MARRVTNSFAKPLGAANLLSSEDVAKREGPDLPTSEDYEQQAIDQIFLADNDMRNLLTQGRDPSAQLLHFTSDFLRRFHVRF